jgi:hypothetical protein
MSVPIKNFYLGCFSPRKMVIICYFIILLIALKLERIVSIDISSYINLPKNQGIICLKRDVS